VAVYVAVDRGGSKNTCALFQPYASTHRPWLPSEARHTVDAIGCAGPLQPFARTVAVALVPEAGLCTSWGGDISNEQFKSSARAVPHGATKLASTPSEAMTADNLRTIAES
jgi:hypothetical protein